MNRTSFLKYLGLAGFVSPVIRSVKRGKNETILSPDILKPQRLKKGDTIGLVSPASILPERERYKEIASTIKELGFNVKIGAHAKSRYGYFAGADIERAADLNAMFKDPAIDAIIPFRGGWGANRILEYIDFKTIQENPKPLIGFSDITSLLLAVYAKTGLITFHGPVGKSDWNNFTFRYFQSAVMEATPFLLSNPHNRRHITIAPGKTEGPLLGGNLTVLTSMLGSGYLPDFEGAILFLEDVGEDVYRIDRMLTQLKLNGVFDRINGLYFGQCTNCEPSTKYSLSLDEVLNDHLRPYDIPAIRGAMIGHIDEMFTLPVGLPATFDADKGEVSFSESAVI
ncbi:LD-carboxypeptidase [Aliifodinibius sp. S!AR15-10]|uniref:S66 peptidase family protein n=1 Tax=Aliifodinibius sp. S!AR15-10 TaxID=2950437 RepID=UPI0028600F98|nr:LD-carboxypeptidase [Aliifodinibius sp. S!AR15-10]MDR8391575.1 LD-carboxypeptidase [Aliifodinibius sp. S!AR15-10]